MKEKIHLYYTNDLHSYFDHWAQVATFIKDKREDSEKQGVSSWTIDIGDHMDRVHPITEATIGKANVKLLNNLHYDFVTIGNNEGITLSHSNFYHLYDEATFNVICSNLECTTAENPKWLQMSKVVSTKHGLKIGFIGLTARFNPYYHLLGWNVKSPYEVIEQELKMLRKEVDIIVLLSHVGINLDREIADTFSDIDCIIGGHTHHLFRTGETVNETILTAGGKHCAFVGEVILTWDHDVNRLARKEAYTTNITHLPKDYETEQRLNELQEEANLILNKEIIYRKEPIEVNWFKETPIMKHLTESLRKWTNADFAMLNAGLLIEDLPAGPVTYNDVHRICPHPINPCVVSLNGDELLEVIRASLSKQFMELELKGFGFRGKVIGRMIFAGIEVQTSFHKNGQEYVKEVLCNSLPIKMKQRYNVATADTFTFGRLLPGVAKSEVKDLYLPEFIREILVHTLLEFDEK